MKIFSKEAVRLGAAAVLLFNISCTSPVDTEQQKDMGQTMPAAVPQPAAEPMASPMPSVPDLQAELLDPRHKTTTSPIGSVDFKNFSYPLPRGWQNPDGADIALADGKLAAIANELTDDMSDEEKAERKAERRIGMSYVTSKFLDVTGDGMDEAIVILQVETGGSAIPQLVYVYEWKEKKPELIWYFRTGDRSDGGLKDLRMENGEFVVELFGQDRFLLGEVETGRITGDEEQLCCPTYFTRTFYKWNGRNFLMQRKRMTYLVADPAQPPQENLGDKINEQEKNRKR